MTQDELTKYKSIYFGINFPDDVVAKKWEMLSPLLPEQSKANYATHIKYLGALMAALLVLVTGTVGVSQAAKPGEPLYTVKQIAEEITNKVNSVFETGKQTIFPPTKQIEHENEETKDESEVKKPQNQENENENIKAEKEKQEVKGVSQEKNSNTKPTIIQKQNTKSQNPTSPPKENNGQGNGNLNNSQQNQGDNGDENKKEVGKPENPGNSNPGGNSNTNTGKSNGKN